MFFKRFIVLAAGVLLFIIAVIVYFDVSHANMEAGFQAEREKFHVDGQVLTAEDPPSLAPEPNTAPAPTPAASAAASATVAAPAPAAPDTNNVIQPLPGPSPVPDSLPAPVPNAPAQSDPNAMPLPGAPSTWNDPRAYGSPVLVRTSYHSLAATEMPAAAMLLGAITSPSAPPAAVPATNSAAPVVVPPAPSPATHEAPAGAAAVSPGGTNPSAAEGSVIVLLYHQFRAPGVAIPSKFQWTLNQDVFASEMKYIHDNGYHVVSVADLLRFLKHEITLPPGSVVITIDDGYKSAIVYAAPILKQYGYPWTFFIYPDFITTGEGAAVGSAASWKDLLALQADGVDIESHSMTHPNLRLHHQKIKGVWHNFTPEEYDQWLTNETAGSKAVLEQKMGKPITCFAYPFGEYNTQVEAKALAAGYEAIFTVAGNPVHSTTNPHSIGRYTITQSEVRNFASDLRQGALGLGDAEPVPGATINNPRPVISAVLGYPGTLDPNSIETSVYEFDVRHDFDPKTNAIRLYLPRDLIQQVVPVTIRVKDAKSGQTMVARWRFNYEPAGSKAPHAPISGSGASASSGRGSASGTNTDTEIPSPLDKKVVGTPLATPTQPPPH